MNAQLVKNQLSECFYKSLFVNSEISIHPINIVNSVKSILGIDLNVNHSSLIDYCINYTNSFEYVDSFGVLDNLASPSAVSFASLEESLINKDIKESLNNVAALLKVSDGKHIIEFLLEFSIKYRSPAFQLVWCVYKMSLFVDHKNLNESIIFCIKYITKNDISPFSNIDIKTKFKFDKYVFSDKNFRDVLIYYSIYNEQLIRYSKIKEYIDINVSFYDFSNSKESTKTKDEQLKYGRKWISLFIKDLDESKLNPDLIFVLDLFRSALKVSDGRCDKIIWTMLNNYLKLYFK